MARQRTEQGDTISKMEAVRRAIAELGADATLTAIQKFVADRFGIEMSRDHISVCKGQIRRQEASKASEAAAKVEPAPAAPAHAGNGAAPSAPGRAASEKEPRELLTKMDGVRWALKELGKNATTLAIQAFLKQNLGMDMSREAIRKYKSTILLKRAARKRATADAAAPAPAAEEASVAAPKPQLPVPAAPGENGASMVRLEDILLLKSLLERVELNDLRTLIEAFGK